MTPPENRAVFIWDSTDVNLLNIYVNKARALGMTVKILQGVDITPDALDRTFDFSQDNPPGFLTGTYQRAWIVISDFSQDSNFLFSNQPYLYERLKCWLDDPANMQVANMCVVIMGTHSGRALWALEGPNRTVITSMMDTEEVDPDGFNMAQHLDSSFNWRSAYEAELYRLANLTPVQTPQILPP